MRPRLSPALLRRALLRPEPLLALLVVLFALSYFLGGLQGETYVAPTVEIGDPGAAPTTIEEIRLVRFDETGLEVPTFEEVALPDQPAGRVRAMIEALRESLPDGQWPPRLPLPAAYVERIDGRQVAVLDFRPEGELTLTVQEERRLLRSISETLGANGFSDLRFLLHGRAEGVFLEHLAVPARF